MLTNEVGFEELVLILQKFGLRYSPSRESEIESELVKYLMFNNLNPKEQVIKNTKRFDIVVSPYIIEIKRVAGKNIVDQLDSYSAYCEGLVVVCWKASESLKLIFDAESKSAKIPVALIEVRNNSGFL